MFEKNNMHSGGKINRPRCEIIQILLVEDNSGDARLVEEMLVEAAVDHFTLKHVEGVGQALASLSEEDFQVILLDLSLNDGYGLGTIERMRNAAAHVPMVVLTGLDDEELAIRAVQRGAQDYLVKGQMNSTLLIRSIRYAIERKRSEEELRAERGKFRELFDEAPVGYHEANTDGYVSRINKTELDMLGYSLAEMLNQPVWKFSIDGQEGREAFKAKISGISPPGRSFERNYRRKDNSILTVISEDRILKDNQGKIIGLRTTIQDITERKQSEKERQLLEEQLRQSQKMEAIGKLAGGIAHDFNNLLTVIKGYSELSLGQTKDDPLLDENLNEIKQASERAVDLTRQLLAFSRHQILEMRVLDLNSILRNLDKMLSRVIGEDIELVFLLASDLGKVKTDPGQIEQVILNLVINARDAMPNGGKLTIETKNEVLDEAYARSHVAVRPGQYVELSVSDTGVGMPQEVRERVFEPFFTTKEKGKGTGLGLSTVYGIVKQSEGNIWLDSKMGQGTTFKIYLPQVDEPVDELRENKEVNKTFEGEETILLVEDDEAVRKLAAEALRRKGYSVLTAHRADEAISLCKRRQEPFHLLLTDVVMPQMSGGELAQSLKQVRNDFKVLYMSGYTDDAIVDHGVLETGVNFIQKPFTIGGLSRKVREVLDK